MPGYVVSLAFIFTLMCSVARADAPTPEGRAAFEAGRDAYEAGRFEEALVQYERAYALSPHPNLLYNIARAADSDGQTERAIQAYEAFLSSKPNAENGDFARARLAKLRASQPPAAAPVSPPAPAPVAAPGIARVQAPAPGPQRALQAAPSSIAVQPLQQRDDTARPLYKNPWLWTAVGVVVVGGVVAGAVLATRDDGPSRANADIYVMTP
jgi:tetratricopeptide (TPR) repeat protein